MKTMLASDSSFVFGPFRLVPNKQLLLNEGRRIKLGGRAFDLLHLLVTRAGEEITKTELIAFAWPKVIVDEQNLKVNINGIRRALQDTFPNPTYIATIVGTGYQFIAEVRSEATQTLDPASCADLAAYDLPSQSPLVGRDADVARVAKAITRPILLTLVGPGGVGKTSVAKAVAHMKRGDFSEGVRWVDLSTIQDQAFVSQIVATGVGAGAQASIAVDCRLVQRTRVLLILDNCEHLLPGVASTVENVLSSSSDIAIIVTSREPLGIEREEVFRVDALAFPNSPVEGEAKSVFASPAVQLFIQRALITADYHVKNEDMEVVVQLSKALDGLPLAIEIAAAALDKLTPVKLLEMVRRPWKELSNPSSESHVWHQTLWSTLDWSYRLLSTNEARLFRLLSIFAGNFESTDVLGMAQVAGLDPFHTNVVLGRLVAKCLVVAEIEEDHPRYRLLETSKHFASHRLRVTSEDQSARRRHAEIVRAMLERAEHEWPWVEHRSWHARYEARMGDISKALDWSFSADGDPRMGVELTRLSIRLWNEQSFVLEQIHHVKRALEHEMISGSVSPTMAALATSHAWSLTLGRRDHTETTTAWEFALRVSESCQELDAMLSALFGIAVYLVYTGHNEDAMRRLVEARRLALAAGSRESFLDVQRLTAFVNAHIGGEADLRPLLLKLADEQSRNLSSLKTIRYKEQRYISIHTLLSFSTYMTGDEDKALGIVDEMICKTSDARQLMGQCHVLSLFALPLAMLSKRLSTLEAYVGMLGRNLKQANIALWEPVHRFYDSFSKYSRGHFRAVEDMKRAIDDLICTGYLVRVPMYLGVLAEALIERRRLDEAAAAVSQAIEIANTSSELWNISELLRVKASLHRALGKTDEARELLREASARAITVGAAAFKERVDRSVSAFWPNQLAVSDVAPYEQRP